jgi:misacylated tRNA(Ala) deacylase
MEISPTLRLYLQDDHCFENEATILAVRENQIAFDQTCFYPGGGGQPPDEGTVKLGSGEIIEVESVYADSEDVIWHVCKAKPSPTIIGESVRLLLREQRRLALMRYHTVLHVLNTIALRDYGGWITGVQINADYSRIDFKLEDFSPSLTIELEMKVNEILSQNHALRSYTISEEEFRNRPELLRTLEAKPPVLHGQVRVVEIHNFDAQACGGTHMHNTLDVGRFSIFRTDNKGKNNKRFYVRLDPQSSSMVLPDQED